MSVIDLPRAPDGPPTADRRANRRGRLGAHLRVPLHKAGYSLIGNAMATSVLGLAFWAVAARSTTEAAVGATGALLAAMRLISHVADLGLRTGLVRFLPALRAQARRVVLGTYLVTGAMAALVAGAFVLVHGRWFDDLTLLDNPGGAALFIVSSAVWVVFVLQDSVLVALRRSTWVPVENAAYGAVKLAILVVAIGAFPQWGIYVAWVAPLPLLVVGVGAVIVGREIPRLAAQPAIEHADLGDLARYSAGDYGGSLLWHSTLELMPLLVLAVAGATESAYYTLAATIAMSLYLIPSAVGYAFVAEAAHDPASASINLRRAARQSIGLVVPAATLVIVASPLILGILGPSYRDDATTLLRLLAASAVPQVVTALAVNWHRARRQVGRIVRLYAGVLLSVLGLGVVLIHRLGATGAGWAWLGAQVVIASILLATTLREMWIGALPTRLLRGLAAPIHRLVDTARSRTARRRLGPDLRSIADTHRLCEPVIRVVQVGRDQTVFSIGDGRSRRIVVKATTSGQAETGRRREHHALARLHADARLSTWHHLVPRPGRVISSEDGTLFVESFMDGRSGSDLVTADRSAEMVQAAADAISVLHEVTAEPAVADDHHLRSWVDGPAARLTSALPHLADEVEAVAREIRQALSGRIVAVGSGHGDLHPDNVVFAPDESRVAGLIDWVEAGDGRLPEVDILTLAVATRAMDDHEEFGAVLGRLAVDGIDADLARLLASVPTATVNGDLPARVLLLLTWLTHVAANVSISETYATNQAWAIRNVEQVLAAVVAPSVPSTPGSAADDAAAPPPETTARAVSTPIGAPTRAPAEVERVTRPAVPDARTTPIALRLLPAATATSGPLLWWLGFRQIDPREIASIGPVADLPPVAFVGLGLVIVGFATALCGRRLLEGWLAAHTAVLVLMLYGIPLVTYGTTRYAWAWKHVGIIDYITRFGTVNPSIGVSDVYHNWPGFFAGAEVVAEVTGVDAITLARWAPVFFALAIATAAFFVLSALVEDRRIAWLGTWLMVAINWVGQEYFSPQATAMVLYLVALGLVLRLDRTGNRRNGIVLVLSVVGIALAIASSHQLTPAMLTISLAGLAVLGRRGSGSLAFISGVLTFGWAVWVAFAFVGPELKEEVGALGALFGNAEDTFVDTSQISSSQAFVSNVGRLAVVIALGLAVVGLVRVWRSGVRPWPAVWLLVAPGFLIASSNFGGEILFRAVMFASPFIGLLGASALIGRSNGRSIGRSWIRGLGVVAVSTVLLAGFLVAHFGKDSFYVFTPEEVAAGTFVAETAPENSLLIEGSNNHPARFLNYEHFRYVAIEQEPLDDQEEIGDDPAGVLSEWMTDPRDDAAYLLITRSQMKEVAALGLTPPGLFTRIDRVLTASPDFDVIFRNRDAVVFVSSKRRP